MVFECIAFGLSLRNAWVAFGVCSFQDFVAPLIALFGEGWTRCFYSRNWQCRVAALTHLSAIMAQRLEELPWGLLDCGTRVDEWRMWKCWWSIWVAEY